MLDNILFNVIHMYTYTSSLAYMIIKKITNFMFHVYKKFYIKYFLRLIFILKFCKKLHKPR